MNKFLLSMIFCVFSYSNTNMYWDLGVAVSTAPNTIGSTNSIDLSTFNRLEGLKKYYNFNFSGALIHFEALKPHQKELILYEYVDSYNALGQYNRAIEILDNYDGHSDNLLYLKSQIFIALDDYDAALLILDDLKNNFPSSDYLEIIKFDLEKINLLK
jgi:tetratricopeptide (TPR) repeat protein